MAAFHHGSNSKLRFSKTVCGNVTPSTGTAGSYAGRGTKSRAHAYAIVGQLSFFIHLEKILSWCGAKMSLPYRSMWLLSGEKEEEQQWRSEVCRRCIVI